MVLEFFLWFLISSKEPPVIQWSDLCVHCIDYATQEYEKNNMYLPILQSKIACNTFSQKIRCVWTSTRKSPSADYSRKQPAPIYVLNLFAF